jgi:hypothetical protein
MLARERGAERAFGARGLRPELEPFEREEGAGLDAPDGQDLGHANGIGLAQERQTLRLRLEHRGGIGRADLDEQRTGIGPQLERAIDRAPADALGHRSSDSDPAGLPQRIDQPVGLLHWQPVRLRIIYCGARESVHILDRPR